MSSVLPIQTRCRELYSELEAIHKEVNAFYDTIRPYERDGVNKELNNCPYSSLGYIMLCFSKIDLFSAYKYGDSTTRGRICRKDQTERMIQYMLDYGIANDRKAANVAVQLWRHKLMHTSQPRKLEESAAGPIYSWLSQWTENQLPRSRHLTFVSAGQENILQLCLTCLIEDVKSSFKKYESALTSSGATALQSNFQTVDNQNTLPQRFEMK